jgi:hypothetical protein
MGMQAIEKACDFIVSKQREDGGWGESYLSCQDKVCTSGEQQQLGMGTRDEAGQLATPVIMTGRDTRQHTLLKQLIQRHY